MYALVIIDPANLRHDEIRDTLSHISSQVSQLEKFQERVETPTPYTWQLQLPASTSILHTLQTLLQRSNVAYKVAFVTEKITWST